MVKAQRGDKVKIHYICKLEDGQVFDSSHDRDPMEFTIGEEQTIPGIEESTIGMGPGEVKEVTLDSDNAFGERMPEMVQAIERAQLPDDVELNVGQLLQVQGPGGKPAMAMVIELDEEKVVLDGNHPLAGRTLIFEIELIEVA
ncbi:MAG: peptidylprolyl isomerase [Pseudomonadota bacterium]